jgi:aspartate carbamoyltransferase catalytic subunit
MHNPQLNKHGELQHLLTTEGLPKAVIHHILDTASSFVSIGDREVKKVPLLRGKSVFNLFLRTLPVPAPRLKLLPNVCQPT